ncbi:hypothetical protein DICVIV_11601 [Dictyocaulus viviparus]|uniref:tRNA (32-2'-O)-methyltransferase regulator THADA-like TPR repeats region domain-containing protein n=1 Tax=Dictyocaulus viviparus TaxID=29172 RepID=A0A0D8XJC3_DICVI|nr:hypothetical protein DICVIV_11601 [Dictyocaulus viviparus]
MTLLKSNSTYMRLIKEKHLERLYSFIDDPALSVVISKILSLTMLETTGEWNLHNRCIFSCLSSNKGSAVKSYHCLNDQLLKCLTFSERSIKEDCIESVLYVSRYLILSNKKCDVYKYWSDYIPLTTMQYAVLHLNVQLRLAAWMLLSEHPQKTLGLSMTDMSLIRVFLITNMTEQSPATRQKILGGLRKVIIFYGLYIYKMWVIYAFSDSFSYCRSQ